MGLLYTIIRDKRAESSGDTDNGVERERGALAAWNQFHMMSDRLSWNHYATP